MRVSVAYAEPGQQLWLELELADGATAVSAINQSGILDLCPDIQLEQQKIGVFGKFVTLDAALVDGDRVEIYRPITWQADEDDDDDD
ncbi:RnfH family protein [Neiella marina]|uniref:UPF0125 protein K0504_13070 n=1 Tax=Neiella holothuriorum TaxID=2870530 RepID=A0ABS7EI05_9GAMM|nr:RnfH family protein [Neiella holothuriorum]MBW8191971.1 RnfH family protein [Neiella holothuriorum]